MKMVSCAPTRVDLAGGTLDIWPLYLFHEDAQTINFATTLYATCIFEPRRDKRIHLQSHDLGLRETFANLGQLIKAHSYKLPLLARLIRAEWNHRKGNAPGITTPLIERLTRVASRHGATAAKVCGAGGGGCVLFYVQDGAKQRVARALAAEGATVLPTGISARGLTIQVYRT